MVEMEQEKHFFNCLNDDIEIDSGKFILSDRIWR